MCVEEDSLLRVEPFIIVRRYTYKAFGNVHVVCNKAGVAGGGACSSRLRCLPVRALTRRDDRAKYRPTISRLLARMSSRGTGDSQSP
jgi:hypothetical protein